ATACIPTAATKMRARNRRCRFCWHFWKSARRKLWTRQELNPAERIGWSRSAHWPRPAFSFGLILRTSDGKRGRESFRPLGEHEKEEGRNDSRPFSLKG